MTRLILAAALLLAVAACTTPPPTQVSKADTPQAQIEKDKYQCEIEARGNRLNYDGQRSLYQRCLALRGYTVT